MRHTKWSVTLSVYRVASHYHESCDDKEGEREARDERDDADDEERVIAGVVVGPDEAGVKDNAAVNNQQDADLKWQKLSNLNQSGSSGRALHHGSEGYEFK